MKKLQEIVRVIDRKRLKRIEIFNEGGPTQRNNLYYKFYKGIKEGRFKTDKEAANELFGCEPSDKKYLMLKSRVKSRLINSLFFLEANNSKYMQAYYRINRNLIASKILIINGAKNTSLSLYRSTLTEAIKYGLSDVALECLRTLRYQSAFLGRQKDFHRYNDQLKECMQVYQAELRAEEYMSLLTLPFVKSFAKKPEMKEDAERYLREIEELRVANKDLDFRLLNFDLLYFRLRAICLQILQDYDELLHNAEETEHFLDTNPPLAMPIRYGECAFQRMIGLLHLGDYEGGKAIATRSLHLFNEGSVNWAIFLEYYFLLCMHTGNYGKASDIFRKVVEHPRFVHLDENRREKWRIFEGFLKYMMGAEEDNPESVASNRFNIWKFLNEVPIYSKDKRGLNIAIIVLQVLFLLDRQDYDGIIKRAEALKVYCSRYLKRDEDFRSNCFLKMVLIMEKKDFDKEATSRIAEKYFSKLKTSRFSYNSGSLATLEIIPYEQLWLKILDKLKDS